MINKILNVSAPKKATVAGALASFSKALEQLREVERANETEAVRQAEAIEQARAAHQNAVEEAALAREVAGKLAELITPALSSVTVSELAKDCA